VRLRLALVAVVLLHLGCARLLLGAGQPYQPWAAPAVGVIAEERGDLLVLHPPAGSAAPRVLLFLHGFASTPAQYRFTLEHLAARGFVVVAPTLPDYFLGFCGYHRAVLQAAQAAYDAAAREAERAGAPPPSIVGYSLGGGAALLVAADRRVPAVLWAPVPLDLELLAPTAPMLVVAADHDCVARDRPRDLLLALDGGAQGVTIAGNHLGFTDRTGGEQFDCPSPVSRQAQREEAVARTAAFLEGG
jgi:dienelactone hydrolase